MQFWKRSLIVQIVGYFLILSFVTVSAICCVAFLQSRAALKTSIIKQLYLTANLKEDELNRWVADQGEEVRTLIKTPEVQAFAPLLIQSDRQNESTAQTEAYQRLSGLLTAIDSQHSSLDEILILTKGSKVVLSTKKSNEGSYEPLVQYSYLPKTQEFQFSPNFYPAPTTGEPRMTFATPIEGATGQQIGILALHLNLSRIDEILRKRPGLGKTGETYLVGNTLPNQGGNLKSYNIFISKTPSHQPADRDVYSQGIALASQGLAGSGVYWNYRGEEVLGVYRWLENHDLALLVEMTTQEAFAPARQLAQTIFTTGLGLVGLLAIVVYYGTQRIAHPILAITQTATQVAAGNLASTAPVLTENEIGILARAFNQMIEQLRMLYTQLEIKVEERTEELRQSRQFLDSIINSLPLALYVKDARQNFRYVLVSRNSEHILGFSPETAIGRNDQELISSEQAAYHLQEDIATLQHSGLVELPEHWIEREPGHRIMVRGWKLPLFDAQGKPSHILGISEDVTDRKQQEQALRLFLEGTAAKTGDVFFNTCVSYLAEILRVRYAFVTEFVEDSETSDRHRVHTLAFWQGVAQGENFEYSIQDTPCEAVLNGELYSCPTNLLTLFPQLLDKMAIAAVSYLGVPLTHSSGKILGHLAVLDVKPMEEDPSRELILKIFAARTGAELERKQVEASLLLAKDAAEAANRAKSAFLANMSHELRTPLNTILGFSQLMERDVLLTTSQKEFLATINQSGEHLLNLINDVLEMSKIEAGRIALNPTTFDLRFLLHTLKEMFQVRVKAKSLSLEFRLANNLPHHVLADEGKLRQVLINLLENAVKFTQIGHIQVQVTTTSPHLTPSLPKLRFEVHDTGCGIAAEDLGQLFQPFSQPFTSSQMGQGTGLGLAISRQFVRLMGGDMGVMSQVNEGTTFWFDIPAVSASPLEISPILPDKRVLRIAPHQPNYRLLIVDDRQENRELMVRLLDMVGFETTTAANGEEAIAQWQAWQPHLIWMDMRMPVMDGYEAARRIRAQDHTHTTKIIALTASAFEEQQVSILAAGCDDLVCKPYKESLIFEKITQHLGTQYLYAEPLMNLLQNSIAPKDLTSDLLSMMPIEWMAQMYQAALRTDEQMIFKLIQQIPSSNQAIADALMDLVHNFRCDKLMDLTQPFLPTNFSNEP
ncbi:MAG: response regulator [Timaviella obliquedivisa GSE-PSE-MK23-08B]|nr:response regulator [Timaviella obliquedivisa GSE-PSE-MK23-08B]